MTTRFLITGILASALAVSAVAVSAREDGHHRMHPPSFSQLDTDQSGEITPDELTAPGRDRLMMADADGDGIVTRDELIAAISERVEKRVDHMMVDLDENRDGQITEDEIAAHGPGKFFDRADKDGSGGLSEEEFAQMHPRGPHMRHRQP